MNITNVFQTRSKRVLNTFKLQDTLKKKNINRDPDSHILILSVCAGAVCRLA